MSTGNYRNTRTTSAFNDINTWYSVIVTHTYGVQKIYVNGINQSLSTGGNHSFNPEVSGNTFKIGSMSSGSSADSFSGLIDRVRVYNRTLSTEEVQGIYNQEKSRYGL